MITPEQICLHVNYYGDSVFLRELFGWLGEGIPDAGKLKSPLEISSPRGVSVRLSSLLMTGLLEEVFIEQAIFDGRALLPFGLHARRETPESAMKKLSANTAAGAGQLISHFMADALIVELAFLPDFVGIERVRIARLGVPQQWPFP